MSTAFGPPGTNRGRTGIPGVGSPPYASEEEKIHYYVPSIQDIYPGYQAPAPAPAPAPVPPEPVPQPAPAVPEEPIAVPPAEAQAVMEPAPPPAPGSYYEPSIADITKTSGSYDAQFPLDPFAKRKQDLRTTGAPQEYIDSLDTYLQEINKLTPQRRKKAFEESLPGLKDAGITDAEILNIRKYFKIANLEDVPPKTFEEMSTLERMGHLSLEHARAEGEMAKAAMKKYEEYVRPALITGRKKLRGAIYEETRKQRMGLATKPGLIPGVSYLEQKDPQFLPGREYLRDMISAENWEGISDLANKGEFATVDELGADWLSEELTSMSEGKTDVQMKAIRRMMTAFTTKEDSTWYREGKYRALIPPSVVEKLPKPIAAIPLTLVAPFEIAADWATDPEQYPRLVLQYVAGRFVVAPATKAFITWANTKPVLGINLTKYLTRWKGSIKTPITDKTVQNFMRNMEHNIDDLDLSEAPINARTFMEWMQLRMRNQEWTKEDVKILKFFLKAKKPGEAYLYVPKNPEIMSQMYAQTRGFPPPTGPLLPTPPPGGPSAPTMRAGATAAATGLDSTFAAAGTVGPSAPGAAISPDLYTKGIVELAATTGNTIEQIKFMRGLDMDDGMIEALSEQNRTPPEGAPAISPVPQDGEKVVIPKLGWQTGTLTDGSHPLEMKVTLDDGTEVTGTQKEIWRSEDLGFSGSITPPAVRKLEDTAKKAVIAENKTVSQASQNVTPNNPILTGSVAERVSSISARAADVQLKADEAVENIRKTVGAAIDGEDVPIPDGTTFQVEPISEAEIQEALTDEPLPTPDLETAVALSTMPDGTPIWQVPLNDYLLKGESPQIRAIKEMRAHQIGFTGVDYKDQKRYIDAIGRIVKQELPDDVSDFSKLRSKWERDASSVAQHEFDSFLSKDHDIHARLAFRPAMTATGIDDPLRAAQVVHRDAVRKALHEGQPVPPEVLKNYPQLRKVTEDPDTVRTVPENETVAELHSRGFLESQTSRMNPEVQEWAVTNNINPQDIAIMKNGQVVEIDGTLLNKNGPKMMKGATTDPSIPEREFNNELSSLDQLMKKLREGYKDEAGFFRIPGGEQILALKELGSQLTKRAKDVWYYRQSDIIRDLEGSIDKWFGEQKVAELSADWAVMRMNKILEKNWWKAHREGGKKFKTPPEEREMIVRYRDDPELFADRYDEFSPQAKALLDYLEKDYQEMWTVAHNAGILDAWLENYINRIYKDSTEKVFRTQYGVSKNNISAENTHSKQRKYPKLWEAEANGLHPILDPVMLNALYHMELARTIANKNLLETLMELKTENGLPAVLSKPTAAEPELLRAWEEDYVPVGIRGMDRWEYAAEIKGKPGFIKVQPRATPKVAKRLAEIFDPYKPRSIGYKIYAGIKAVVMGLKMINPFIHLSNVGSDVLDEFNFNIALLGKVTKTPGIVSSLKDAYKMYHEMDERIIKMCYNSLDLKLSHELSNEMRRITQDQIAWLDDLAGPLKTVTTPVRKLMEASHKFTWEGVRYSQIAMCDMLTKKFMEQHPNWTEDQAMKVAAHWTNTNLGTMPHHWMKPWVRKYGSFLFFARQWTLSNLDMIAKAFTSGRLGFGMKGMNKEERRAIGRHAMWHLIKGMFGLLVIGSGMQMTYQYLTNKAKEAGLMKGAPVPVRPSFMNESKRHIFDIWIGHNKKGQHLYTTGHLFRYMRDYIGFATEPMQTLNNKLSIEVRTVIEVLGNYMKWKNKPIIEKAAPKGDQFKAGIRYFLDTIFPSNLYAKQPGSIRTKAEWIIPFTGAWIRRGTPGGRGARLYYDFDAWQRYRNDKLYNEFSEAIQKGDMDKIIEIGIQLYSTVGGIVDAIEKHNTPLWWLSKRASKEELMEFDRWLKKEGKPAFRKAYTLEEIFEGIEWEFDNLEAQRDEDPDRIAEQFLESEELRSYEQRRSGESKERSGSQRIPLDQILRYAPQQGR